MARYSVAEAKNTLPKLLDRALAGEEVDITRRGEVIARLTPKKPVGGKIDLAWLDAVRVTPIDGPGDIVADLEAMRRERPY